MNPPRRLITVEDEDAYKLRIPAKPVEFPLSEDDRKACRYVDSLFQHNRPMMAGLSAIQVDIPKRIIALPEGVFINPVYHEDGFERSQYPEGCWSLPGRWFDVRRPANILLYAQNTDGEFVVKRLGGMSAMIAMHETDHLDGVLISSVSVLGLPYKTRPPELRLPW